MAPINSAPHILNSGKSPVNSSPNFSQEQRQVDLECPELFPVSVWWLVCTVLGIRVSPLDKSPPITAVVLRVATILSALTLFLTNLTYSGYNTLTDNGRNDVLDGLVSIMVVSFFCFIGIYSQKLARRLYTHKMICKMMQFKVGLKGKVSILLGFILLASFIFVLNLSTLNFMYSPSDHLGKLGRHNKTGGLYNYSDPSIYDPTFDTVFNGPSINPCKLVILQIEVCQVFWISQAIFSLFFMLWSFLVVIVLVVTTENLNSDLKRFIRLLQDDAERRKENLEKMQDSDRSTSDWLTRHSMLWLNKPPACPRPLDPTLSTEGLVELDKVLGESCKGEVLAEQRLTKPMDNEEVLARHWHLGTTAMLISIALQKWLGCLLCLVGTWGLIRAAYWFSSAPSIPGICMFLVPLLLVPVLTSPYARVNYTAGMVQRYIFPTLDRVEMFQYLDLQHIGLTVYSHRLSFGSVGTVVFTILAAFASKIVLQDLNMD